MPKKPVSKRPAKSVLRLPDLDHSKTSVLQSLGSVASKRTYAYAINDFITWYCSEPRLAFGRTVVLRYRYELEARRLAAATINLRLAAVRRLAYEAADNGLLSPDLAASIRRVQACRAGQPQSDRPRIVHAVNDKVGIEPDAYREGDFTIAERVDQQINRPTDYGTTCSSQNSESDPATRPWETCMTAATCFITLTSKISDKFGES